MFCRSDRFSVHQPAALHRVAHDDQHFLVLERLGDVVERAALHRGNRALDRRVRGDDQDRQVLVDPLQLVERGDAVEPRHHDVDDRRVERQRASQLEPFGARRREPDVVAGARQQRLEDFTHDLLVVDDEDGALLGVGHLSTQVRAKPGRSGPPMARTASGNARMKRVPCPTALSQRIVPSCS